MAADPNDKFRKSYSFLTKSLSSNVNDSTTTIPLNNTTNVPTDTAVDFIIDRVDANGNRTPSTRELCSGVVSGSNIVSVTRGLQGTTAQAHTSGAVVEFVNSGEAWNDLMDGLLVSLDQDGTLKSGAVDAAAVLASNVVTTAKILDGNVTTPKLADASITNAKLATTSGEIGAALQSWTPTISASGGGSPAIGNGTFSCQYVQIGKLVFGHFKITRGSTTSFGTGEVRFSLPVTASTNQGTGSAIGQFYTIDASAPADYGGLFGLVSTTTFRCLFHNDTIGGGMRTVSESGSQPFAWATSDIIDGNFMYEAA